MQAVPWVASGSDPIRYFTPITAVSSEAIPVTVKESEVMVWLFVVIDTVGGVVSVRVIVTDLLDELLTFGTASLQKA